MSFSDTAEVPIVVNGHTFPKLKLKNIGVLAGKYKAALLDSAKKTLAQEKATEDAKLKYLVNSSAAQYSLEDVWDWSRTLEGSRAVAIQSLLQGGMVQKEAEEAVDDLAPGDVRNIAMEVCDHPNAPSKAKKPEGEQNPNPPSGG